MRKTSLVRRAIALIVGQVILGTAIAATPAGAVNAAYALDIPAQSLNDALQALALASKHELLYPAKLVDGMISAPLKGKFTTEEAVKQLLAGTDLTFEVTSDGLVVIRDRHTSTRPLSSIAEGQTDEVRLSQSSPADSSEGAPQTGFSPKEEDRTKIQEVIVTAQKREERLIDVPQSVSVLSADDLARSGATSFRDFADQIPGLSYRSSGPGMNQVTLRGVSVGLDVSTTVGTYVDDVPYGSSTSFAKAGVLTLDPGVFGLERIEVLKGPQGTLYGATAMGGLLRYITRRPETSRFGWDAQTGVSATRHGSMNYNAGAAVNIPFVKDRAALRVSGFETHDGGYIDNLTLGDDNVGSSDIYGGRLDLLFTPIDRLSIRINGFLQNVTTDGFPVADFTRAGVPIDSELAQRRNFSEEFTYYFRLASATVNYDFDGASLTSISSYQTGRSDIFADLTTRLGGTARTFISPTVAFVGYSDQQSTKKFAQEVRLTSKDAHTLDWVIGGFYTDESSENHQQFVPYLLSGPILPNNLFTFFVPSTYEEFAGFGDLTWHLSERFDVTGGLRYARNQQTFRQDGGGLLGRSGPESRSEQSTTTYLANARYHFNKSATAYVRYATGFRPGGPNFLVVDPTTGLPIGSPTYQPDTIKSYEIGIKADMAERRFGLEVAAYQIDWSNIQISVQRGGLGATDNAPGGATIRGAELGFTARPVSGLTASGTFGYQNAKFSNDVAALGAADGERLSGVPRFTTTFNADYELPWGEKTPIIGATLHYQDGVTNGYGITAPYRTPSYTTVDLRGGMTLGAVSLQLYVRNLADEQGQIPVRLQFFPVATGPIQSSIIQPRTFGVQAMTRF